MSSLHNGNYWLNLKLNFLNTFILYRLFVSIFFLWSIQATAQLKRFEFSQSKMGSPFYLIFYTTDTAQAAQQATKTFLFVDSMFNIFSDYIDSSEINRLSVRAGSIE